jgi:hypothetical protein
MLPRLSHARPGVFPPDEGIPAPEAHAGACLASSHTVHTVSHVFGATCRCPTID